MAIRKFKPYTPGTRQRVVTDFSEITGSKPERSLIVSKHRNKGRNNRGVITCRHRGGGHKRQYRLVDFRRDKKNMPGSAREVYNAEEEGIEFIWLSNPKKFIGTEKISSLLVEKMKLGMNTFFLDRQIFLFLWKIVCSYIL